MRLLMTTDAVGGVWDYCMELIRGLQPLEVEVTLACTGPGPRAHQHQAIAKLDNVELVIHEGRLEWMQDCEDELARVGEWLLELERRARPDLVHVNGYAHAALPLQAPAIVVGHSCVLSWSRAVHKTSPPPSWDAYRRRVRAGLARARAVVAPTAWMLAQLWTGYGVHFEGLVINNARRSEDFFPAGPKRALILGAGRLWDQAKNLASLDAAAAQLSWPVLVAGETRDEHGREVSAHHVELLGALPSSELARWMAQASIFAHPARYEPFGLAPLEAALSGCALVLGDIGSLREIWGDAALFVDPEDHEALATVLRALIDDPARRSMMATRAQTRAHRYCVSRMVTAYHNLYLEVAHDRIVTACAS
jgi:glycosyltransferase involved in cell wall biosynthesis